MADSRKYFDAGYQADIASGLLAGDSEEEMLQFGIPQPAIDQAKQTLAAAKGLTSGQISPEDYVDATSGPNQGVQDLGRSVVKGATLPLGFAADLTREGVLAVNPWLSQMLEEEGTRPDFFAGTQLVDQATDKLLGPRQPRNTTERVGNYIAEAAVPMPLGALKQSAQTVRAARYGTPLLESPLIPNAVEAGMEALGKRAPEVGAAIGSGLGRYVGEEADLGPYSQAALEMGAGMAPKAVGDVARGVSTVARGVFPKQSTVATISAQRIGSPMAILGGNKAEQALAAKDPLREHSFVSRTLPEITSQIDPNSPHPMEDFALKLEAKQSDLVTQKANAINRVDAASTSGSMPKVTSGSEIVAFADSAALKRGAELGLDPVNGKPSGLEVYDPVAIKIAKDYIDKDILGFVPSENTPLIWISPYEQVPASNAPTPKEFKLAELNQQIQLIDKKLGNSGFYSPTNIRKIETESYSPEDQARGMKLVRDYLQQKMYQGAAAVDQEAAVELLNANSMYHANQTYLTPLNQTLRPQLTTGASPQEVTASTPIITGNLATDAGRAAVAKAQSVGKGTRVREQSLDLEKTLFNELKALPETYRTPSAINRPWDMTQMGTYGELYPGLALSTIPRNVEAGQTDPRFQEFIFAMGLQKKVDELPKYQVRGLYEKFISLQSQLPGGMVEEPPVPIRSLVNGKILDPLEADYVKSQAAKANPVEAANAYRFLTGASKDTSLLAPLFPATPKLTEPSNQSMTGPIRGFEALRGLQYRKDINMTPQPPESGETYESLWKMQEADSRRDFPGYDR